MSNKENFRRQLDQGLSNKKRAKAESAEIKRIEQKQKEAIKKQEKTTLEREEKQRNREVLELDAKLPIRQTLEDLKNKINPIEYVRKYGPKKGQIAYAFIYPQGTEIWIDQKTEEVRTTLGGGTSTRFTGPKSLKVAIPVFGVILKNDANLVICGGKTDGIWPVILNPFSSYGCWSEKNHHNMLIKINMAESGGVQKFKEALTDFYVGLKTGQGK